MCGAFYIIIRQRIFFFADATITGNIFFDAVESFAFLQLARGRSLNFSARQSTVSLYQHRTCCNQ
jgi:hypothetical protein